MKDEKEQVEIFEEEEILEFTDDEGKEVKLLQIACVEHEGEFYSLLENYERLPSSLQEARKLALESNFIKEYIPQPILDIYCEE